MIFTPFWAAFFIILFSIVGLASFIYRYFSEGFKQHPEDWDNVKDEYEALYEEEVVGQADFKWMEELPAYMSTFNQAIDHTIRDLFFTMLIYMLIATLVLSIALLLWITPVKTFFPFLLSFVWGQAVFTIIAYFTSIITVGTLNKMAIRTRDYKEDSIKFAYGNGFFLALFIVSLILLNLLILVIIMKAIFLNQRDLISYQRMGIGLTGYPFGMIFSSFFLREGISLASRGVIIATDLIIKNDRFIAESGNVVSYTSKVTSIVASQLANVVVNYLDATIIITIYVTLPFIISSQSTEIQKEVHLWGILLGPSIVLSFNMIGAIISVLFISIIADRDTSSFTAKNIRWQIIIASIFSLISVTIIMIFITPPVFTFGIAAFPALRFEGGTNLKIMACGVLGLVANIILLILFEYLTSHGYQPVRKLSQSAENAPTLNVIQAYAFGYISQSFALILFGLLFIVLYKLGGLIGILSGLVGFIMNILILLPILFLAGVTHDGHRCANIAQIAQQIIDRIYKISWASRNYQIYLRITNAGCFLFIGILTIGATMEFGQTQSVMISSGQIIFGFLIGASLTFLNKGLSIQAVKNVTEACLDQERLMQNQIGTEYEHDAMNNYADQFFLAMYKLGAKTLSINILLSTIIICSNGLLFGLPAAIGLQTANLLVSIMMILLSLISGTGLKNSKLFNQRDPKNTEASPSFVSHLYGDIQGMGIEESQCVPLIVFTSYNIFLTFIGYEIFKKTGWIS